MLGLQVPQRQLSHLGHQPHETAALEAAGNGRNGASLSSLVSPQGMAGAIRSLLLPPLMSLSQRKSPSPPKGHSTLVLHEMTLGDSS